MDITVTDVDNNNNNSNNNNSNTDQNDATPPKYTNDSTNNPTDAKDTKATNDARNALASLFEQSPSDENNVTDEQPLKGGSGSSRTSIKSDEVGTRESAVLKNVLLGAKGGNTLSATNNNANNNTLGMSTLSKQQQSWLDPDEAGVTDSFYSKDFNTLRPNFNNVEMAIRGIDELKGSNALTQLFVENDSDGGLDGVEVVERKDGAEGMGGAHGTGAIENATSLDDAELEAAEKEKELEKREAEKFGVWDGVYARCLLNIFGVIMFLRIGWMVGHAGVIHSVIIILLSGLVTLLTTLSMSAICTNGQILGGGAYYIISRALGPSIGGSVGVMFSIGNMVAVSLYLIGFAETLVEQEGAFITGSKLNDIQIWSNLILIFSLVLALLGLKYVVKVQLGLLAFIVVSIIMFFIGSVTTTKKDVLYGVDGWTENLPKNWGPGYKKEYADPEGETFFGVLAVFFPAMTGIMAGANISGDLKDPGRAIPLGTLSSVFTSVIIYCFMALVVGAVTARTELVENTLVMADICVWEWFILLGVYAATLSSAIASLVGAPRILQAIATDNILPSLGFFAVVNKDGEPVRGYFLSFIVAAGCNCVGELNFIAPIITLFFMIAYLMINFSCGALELSKSPGWRPSFQYFNKWTAFFGAATCLAFMILIDYVYAVISIVLCFGIYLYIEWKDPIVNWGNVQSSRNFYTVYKSLLRLRNEKKRITNVKNWRPSFLVLTGDPLNKPQLVLFSQTLRKAYGPIFVGTVAQGDYRRNMLKFRESNFDGYLPKGFFQQKTNGFYEKVIASDRKLGVTMLIQTCGIGTLRPNTLMFGFQHSWQTSDIEKVDEYIDIIRDAILMGMNIVICVGFKRVNWHQAKYVPPPANPEISLRTEFGKKYTKSAVTQDVSDDTHPYLAGLTSDDTIRDRDDVDTAYKWGVSAPPDIKRQKTPRSEARETVTEWQMGQGMFPIIDVWWLIDDGGLCMLLPYIMNLHQFWKRCRLRVNLILHDASQTGEIAIMETLIQKFRLPYEKPRTVIVENNEPCQQTFDRFEKYSDGIKIEDLARPSVMKKWLRLGELMFEHSRYSGLVIVTLPLPAKNIPTKAYMALLECLSDQKRMPPMIFLRGNGESTLTYYSE